MSEWREVALIAPHSDILAVEDEVRVVSSALPTVTLRETVSVGDVMRLLTSRRWEIVWFACHGSAAGVELGGPGNTLDTSTLIQLIRNSGAELVVLNTCESAQMATYLCLEARVAVICTVAAVGDVAGATTGALLAHNLAAGMDVAAAYARSVPGDVGLAQRYRLFDGRRAGDEEGSVPEFGSQNMTDAFRRITDRESVIVDRISALDTRLSVMEHDIRRIQEGVEAVHERVGHVPPGYWALWAMMIFVALIQIATIVWMAQLH